MAAQRYHDIAANRTAERSCVWPSCRTIALGACVYTHSVHSLSTCETQFRVSGTFCRGIANRVTIVGEPVGGADGHLPLCAMCVCLSLQLHAY